MAEAGPTLSELYKDLWDTYLFTETTNEASPTPEYQVKLKHGIKSGETAIHMVNQLHLYSSNENIEEVATNEVKYLLLPAILGYLTSLLTLKDRLEVVTKAKDYFTDYLRLCKSYEVTDLELPPDSSLVPANTGKGPPDLEAMAKQRADKIKRFQQQKEITQRLKELSVQVEKEHVDDEVKREYYVTLCKKWVDKSFEELESLNCEVTMLKFREQSMQNGEDTKKDNQKPPKKEGFRPFIITKDMIQKKVFGAGYPSLPTMTIEEFYEQKVKDGTFQIPQAGHSMQDWAKDPEKDAQAKEKEEEEKEKKIEEDDEETLQKARNMDEYKDDHRRGWGNRKNMG